MKIEKLIKDLQAFKKLGVKEIYFSSDEEGNNIYKDAVIDGNINEMEYTNSITIYPLQDQKIAKMHKRRSKMNPRMELKSRIDKMFWLFSGHVKTPTDDEDIEEYIEALDEANGLLSKICTEELDACMGCTLCQTEREE